MDNFLTVTGSTHTRNSAGSGAPATISSSVTHSPLDPVNKAPTQEYPIDKLFLLKQFFTKYTAFVKGDYITVSGVTYAIKSAQIWGELGGLDNYYEVYAEEQQ